MVGDDDAAARFRSLQPRAAQESSAEPRVLNGASQDCTDAAEPRHACPARSIFENRRSPESLRAESATKLRPLRKTRSVLSAAIDIAMEDLGLSNGVVADACGVHEKTVRQWRGRGLLPGEVAKPMPSDMLFHLPVALYDRVDRAIKGGRDIDRAEARAKAGRGR